ncbi:MAG TPA: hypothetical protein PLV92_06290 [Pirellulaceae bacterium]|nr:hypothetical protein [Pirellulaceae bacterium]
MKRPAWTPADIVRAKRTLADADRELDEIRTERDELRRVLDRLTAALAEAQAERDAAKPAAKPPAGKNLRLQLAKPTLDWLKDVAGARGVGLPEAAAGLLDEIAADDGAAHARAAQ